MMLESEDSFYWLSRPMLRKYGMTVASIYGTLLGECSDYTIDEPVIPEEPVIMEQEEIARRNHISVSTVNRTLKKMEEIGLIQQIHTGRASTFRIYPFDDPDFDDDSE